MDEPRADGPAPPSGHVLLVGVEPALAAKLGRVLAERGFAPVKVVDALAAAQELAHGEATAVVVDFAGVPPADREALARVHRERGGFALIGLEASASLLPAVRAPLRRVPWPLPGGFLDQVRSAAVPVVLLVEPTLFLTRGIQGALREAGVHFFQIDSLVGAAEMIRERVEQTGEERGRAAAGFWRRGAGDASAPLGFVAVVNVPGGVAEAAQFDARLRRVLADAATYWILTIDPPRAAVLAVTGGQPAVLPRDYAPRVADILVEARSVVRTAPRVKESLLLVDNDVPTLSRLAESLLALGFDVTTTVNGEEALRLAAQKTFHLAAIGGSALEATKLSGAKLALQLRERDKDLRIILMVDQFPVQDALKGVSRAVELGLDDAILKPVDASRLALSIRRALERRFLILENARLLKEVQDSARQLAQVNGFQTKFFATVAHDVKNPLTAILGYSEVLGTRLKDKSDELKCAIHITSAARALDLLISDLVDLAAIESGKLRVELGALDLAQVVAEVKSRVDVVAQRKQLALSVRAPDVLPALRGDPHRIGQAIQNLCTNAVQYTKAGGRVSIEVAVQPDWVVVGVRDTGIGIAKEDLPRVWERFFQTKEAQTMRKAGFGLGLKIAREIVQMHGGDMGIESELGVGSFFFFRLPVPKA